MKECTYGWYPPAKDIWKTYRAKSSTYEAECLYKHGQSRYNNQPGKATPVAPTPIQLEFSPQPARSPPVRSKSAASVTSKPPRPPSTARSSVTRNRPSPRKAWTSYIPPATSLHVEPPSQVHDTATIQSTQKPQRVQSAHSHRPRVCTKPRPVKSAGTARTTQPVIHRSASAESVERQHHHTVSRSHSVGRRPQSTDSQRAVRTPAPTPAPPPPQYVEEYIRPQSEGHSDFGAPTPAPPPSPPPAAEIPRTPSPVLPMHTPPPALSPMNYTVYENQLNQHGWRMQVHGDPLGLKGPCIPQRKSYTVEVPIPDVMGEGPKGYMVNYDTHFLNTIPRRRATFDVHKDWISEVLHAKRMELQKRDGGIKYRYKNFSFVY